MNYSKAVFLISDDVRAVMVTYEKDEPDRPAPRTMYKTFNTKIKVDDFVVVPTKTRHHMTVCKVVQTDVEVDLESSEEMEWVIGVVNRADFEKIKSQEGDAIAKIKSAEKRRKREELRKALLDDVGEKEIMALPIYTGKKRKA